MFIVGDLKSCLASPVSSEIVCVMLTAFSCHVWTIYTFLFLCVSRSFSVEDGKFKIVCGSSRNQMTFPAQSWLFCCLWLLLRGCCNKVSQTEIHCSWFGGWKCKVEVSGGSAPSEGCAGAAHLGWMLAVSTFAPSSPRTFVSRFPLCITTPVILGKGP